VQRFFYRYFQEKQKRDAESGKVVKKKSGTEDVRVFLVLVFPSVFG
jgi:hypothetical protein